MKHFFLECGSKWAKGMSLDSEENPSTARSLDMSTIEEILVIFFCGIGDMVVFIPALEALSTFFCKSHISVMTSPPADELLHHHPYIKSTFSPKAIYQKGFFQRFDLIINLSGDKDELNRILRTEKVKHLITRDRLFTRKYPLHASEYHLELVNEITAPFSRPLIHVTDEERRVARRYLVKKKLNPREHFIIAVHAGSSNPSKFWDWRRFRKVCNLLMRDFDAKILLLSGPSEQEVSERIAKNMGNQLIVIQQPLRIVAALLEQCRLLITNDSGIMHLAAAVGTPIVSIFNSSLSKPEIWGPLSDNHVVICQETHEAIRVEDVMSGVKLLLSRAQTLAVPPS